MRWRFDDIFTKLKWLTVRAAWKAPYLLRFLRLMQDNHIGSNNTTISQYV